MVSISEASEKIRVLVEKYQRVLAEGKEHEFNEEKVKIQFINPFLEALGWDVRGEKDSDEVIPEQRTVVGPVDFSLRVNGKEKIFFELKSFSEELSGYRTVRGRKQYYTEQAINYAWHRKVDWAVLTNFKELRLYYAHVRKPEEGLIFSASFDEYLTPEKLSKIWLLSKEAILVGLLDREEKRRTRRDIDVEVLEDLFESRKLLTKDVYGKYRGVDVELIKEGIQRILDRLIVMRFMEDKGIVPAESLLSQLENYNSTVDNKEATPFMKYLKIKFEEFNETYNSKIFEPHECDKFAISNKTLQTIIKTLYKYNFDLIDADVLGNIYEDYLGYVLEEKGRGVEIVEKQAKRKEHGIYYTPTFVVDYIVRNTVGALIEERKQTILKQKFGEKDEKLLNDEERKELGKLLLSEINKIKILDPACGSGSFLIKTFDVIKEYYDTYGLDSTGPMTPEKRILLNNIHGVDLDRQATEIASVNLILKALKKGQKLPLVLDENIRNGNSLISGSEEELREYFGDEWKEKKPFDWEEEFKDIFENGGFDVVIGNPPYVRIQTLEKNEIVFFNDNFSSASGNYDIYSLFVEKSLSLLKPKGLMGFILPHKFFQAAYGSGLREAIRKNKAVKEIVNFRDNQVFRGASTYTCLLFLQKEFDNSFKYAEIYNLTEPSLQLHTLRDKEDYQDGNMKVGRVPKDQIFEQVWNLTFDKESKLINKIKESNPDLKQKTTRIFQGLKTSGDGVYILDMISEKTDEYIAFSHSLNRNVLLEKDLLHPLIKGGQMRRYSIRTPKKVILFPYENGQLIEEQKLKEKYPKSWTYLLENKKILESRERGKMKGEKWYAYGRTQALEVISDPKLITPDFAASASFCIDFDGTYYFTGGAAGGYGIIPKKDVNPKFLLALLNSKLLDWYLHKKSTIFRGGYISYESRFIKHLPIKLPNPEIQHGFIELADHILALKKEYNETLDTFKKILDNMSDSDTKQLPLKEYYPSSDYGINPVESQKLLDIRRIGKVTKLEVFERDDDIVIRGEYIPGEKETGTPLLDDILKIRFTDSALKKFFYYSIKTFLLYNSKKKMWGRGRIVDVVLKAIKLPRFYNLKIKDVEQIRELMAEFFKASPIADKNLSEVEKEIEETDRTIDKKVYELYELTEEEIKIIKEEAS